MVLPAYLDLPRCEEIFDLLSEFLDGELADDARHRVTVHLAICPRCAGLATDLAATIRVLHGLRSRRAPPGPRQPR